MILPTLSAAQHEQELFGQTVVVIGGSAGVGVRDGPPRAG
jgi:hypothetical protein